MILENSSHLLAEVTVPFPYVTYREMPEADTSEAVSSSLLAGLMLTPSLVLSVSILAFASILLTHIQKITSFSLSIDCQQRLMCFAP